MTPEKVIEWIKWVVIAALGVAVWWGNRERSEGSDDAKRDAAINELREIAKRFAEHLDEEQAKAVERARKEGAREAWEAMIEARVKEMDATLEVRLREIRDEAERGSSIRARGGR